MSYCNESRADVGPSLGLLALGVFLRDGLKYEWRIFTTKPWWRVALAMLTTISNGFKDAMALTMADDIALMALTCLDYVDNFDVDSWPWQIDSFNRGSSSVDDNHCCVQKKCTTGMTCAKHIEVLPIKTLLVSSFMSFLRGKKCGRRAEQQRSQLLMVSLGLARRPAP